MNNQNDFENDDLDEVSEEVFKKLDPRLYDLFESQPARLDAVEEDWGDDESPELSQLIDVIAELDDPEQQVPGLNIERKSGNLVTGSVRVSQIVSVRSHPNVKGIQMARPLHPELDESVKEICATAKQLKDGLPSELSDIDGSDVIVGVIDYECDFAHKNFQNSDGTTRLLYLWDQVETENQSPPKGFGYGREFDAAKINKALQTSKPYDTLGYNPKYEEMHGTHVLDIAAGNGNATNRPGVAPGADLIFVHVSTADVPVEESFGNSRRLLDAVDYIFDKASECGKSAVINISLGTHGGPHDGSTYVERWFDQRLLEAPGRAIVQSAGNYKNKGCHAQGTIDPDGKTVLTWEIDPEDKSFNEMEIWYEDGHIIQVTVIGSNGDKFGPQLLNQLPLRYKQGGKSIARITNQRDDYGDNKIDILLHQSLNGQYKIELKNLGDDSATFHAWIERDSKGQSKFSKNDQDSACTLGSIANSRLTIAVGSYNARSSEKQISSFSSQGTTRDLRNRPEVSAPGHSITAASSLTQGVTTKSGTSMAAPHVTGLVALLMQVAGNQALPIEKIRSLLFDNARKNPPHNSEWHSQYGHGRVDCLKSLLAQLAISIENRRKLTGGS